MGRPRQGSRLPARRARERSRTAFPGFIPPCLATQRTTPPAGEDWAFEIKHDGYRTQAHLKPEGVTLFTRRGYDWSETFASVAEALQAFPAREAVIDGEVTVLDAGGRADFRLLQGELARHSVNRLSYIVFDLLYLDGADLRNAPLSERRRRLEQLIRKMGESRIQFSEEIAGAGPMIFQNACQLGLEGILCKQRGAPYRSGRQDSWIKVKCTRREAFPIIAFVEKLGARPRRIASLYVGRWEEARLLYAGKVQSGFTLKAQRELREQLDPLVRKTSPLSSPVKKPKATWVEPRIEAEVSYSALTSDHLLRAAVFKGARESTDAVSQRAGPAVQRPVKRHSRGTVPKENILQLVPDALVPTPQALKAYWRTVAHRALKHLGRRPLKLVRHSRGTTFYHKGPLPALAPGVHDMRIHKREGGEGVRVWVDDLQGLLGLVDMDVVEVHPWNATVDDIECADVLVFDLDPGPGVEWKLMQDTAQVLRELLKSEGYASWPKLTGGKGVHVMAPLGIRLSHDKAHRYARSLAERVVRLDPDRLTLSASVGNRPKKIFIDYLRNGRGTTAVGAYSPRARAGFPIAAPVTWKQIGQGIRPDAYAIERPK